MVVVVRVRVNLLLLLLLLLLVVDGGGRRRQLVVAGKLRRRPLRRSIAQNAIDGAHRGSGAVGAHA